MPGVKVISRDSQRSRTIWPELGIRHQPAGGEGFPAPMPAVTVPLKHPTASWGRTGNHRFGRRSLRELVHRRHSLVAPKLSGICRVWNSLRVGRNRSREKLTLKPSLTIFLIPDYQGPAYNSFTNTPLLQTQPFEEREHIFCSFCSWSLAHCPAHGICSVKTC